MQRLSAAFNRADPAFALVLVVLLAGAVRFVGLGRESLWLDEAFSWAWSQLSMSSMWGDAAAVEPNPPLYFALLKIWTGWFGETEFGMRSLSALLGAASIGLVYLIGRFTLGREAALLGALLAALSTTLVAYGQEARGFALLSLAALIAVFGLLRFIAAATPQAGWVDADVDRLARPSQRLANLFLYVIGASVALYAHATAVTLPLLANLVALAVLLSAKEGKWRLVLEWIVANLVVLLVLTGWLPLLIAHATNPSTVSWLTQPSPARALFIIVGLYGPGHLPGLGKWGALLLPLPLLALFVLRPGARPRLPVFILLFFVIAQPLLLYAAGLVTKPLLIERTAVWPVGLGFLLIAAGLLMVPVATLRNVAIAGVLTLMIADLVAYGRDLRKEPWRDAVALIADTAGERDIIVLDPGSIDTFALVYYGRETALRKPFYIVSERDSRFHSFFAGNGEVGRFYEVMGANELREFAGEQDARIWLLVFRSDSVRRRSSDMGEATAEKLGHIQFEQQLHRKLKVIGIEP